jgi:hypothetical protein
MIFNLSNILIVRLEGGLGNQLFQYAFAISKAQKLNKPFLLDLSSYHRQSDRLTKRNYALDFLNIENRIYSPTSFFLSILFNLNLLAFYALIMGRLFKEKSINFDQFALANESKSYFSGYWQSHKYFIDNVALIAKSFEPNIKPNSYIEGFLSKMSPKETVMIHIRRGDYVTLESANTFHGLLDNNYYEKSINFMLSKNPNYKFLVFSDEIEYCKKMDIFANLNVEFIENDDKRAEWQDLYLMSFCSNQIIANSSFSWWSAWLSDSKYARESRTVIAPINWFNSVEYNSDDRYPSHWVLM